MHPKHVQLIQGQEETHVVDRRRVRTGFTDNLQLPIVGLWRRTTIVDEGREDALPRGGLPRELSALSRISQGPILQRGREAPVWTELRQVMMGYFLPLLPLTVSWQQDNNLS